MNSPYNRLPTWFTRTSMHAHTVVAGVLLPDDANSLDAGALGKGQGSTGYVQAESLEKVWEIIKADALWTNGVVRTRSSRS